MWPIDHQRCFQIARIVLRNDNRSRINLIDQYAGEIRQGLYDADWGQGTILNTNIPVASTMHYLDPYANVGVGGWIGIGGGIITNAALFCDTCFNRARQLWQSDQASSMRVFGVALHLVQDLTVPHHARNQPSFNHTEYERWLDEQLENTGIPDDNTNIPSNIPTYIPTRNGIYDPNRYPLQWVYSNARSAYGYFGYCDGINRDTWNPLTWFTQNEDLIRVRNAMIPLAIRTSAGFIDCFLSKI